MRTTALVLVALASSLFVGCAPAEPTGPDPIPAPPFPEGTGQAAHEEIAYAPGPFGVKVGSVIENYHYKGFANAMVQNDVFDDVQLADFYNPTGTDVYAEGSPYGAGNPKPKALLIDVASVWCGPCNYEADSVLPGEYAQYKPLGGEFLLQLADGPTPGISAKETHLRNWTNKYDVDYPSSIDPEYRLMDLAVQDAFPQNFLIDTTTMEIVDIIAGVPDATFFAQFDALLE
jgi:hypothetical protein